jgi:hypothetical protein
MEVIVAILVLFYGSRGVDEIKVRVLRRRKLYRN